MTNTLKTAVLLAALSAVFLFLGEALGGSQGLVLGFMFAAVTNIGSYWFSDKIVLRMYGAKEVGPEHPLYHDRRRGWLSEPDFPSRGCTSFRRPLRTRSRPAAIRSTPPWRRPRASCGC